MAQETQTPRGRRWPIIALAAAAALSIGAAGVGFAEAQFGGAEDTASAVVGPNAQRIGTAPQREPAAPREPLQTLDEARASADAIDRPLTVVSLTFDDGTDNQWAAVEALDAIELPGTFYVPSGHIDGQGALSYEQLVAMQASGHEIGGHTVNHADLAAIDSDEAARQICDDRSRLLDWGFDARSFAYPFARSTPELQRTVLDCGYESGRMLGALQSPDGCLECAAVEDLQPAEPANLRAPAQVDSTWTLDDLQGIVLRAEQTGGWVPITFHNVCDSGCEINITPKLFAEFAGWLAERQATQGTAVLAVGDVIGGETAPAVAGPEDAPTTAEENAIRNPTLEADAAGIPSCWMTAGYGDSSTVHDTVSPGHSGAAATRVTVEDYRDGDAKWLPSFDLGECSPAVEAGATYDLGSWYASTGSSQFAVYLRNELGGWQYWTASSWFPQSEGYRQAAWTTPPIPEGYEAISFGLALIGEGELVTDDVSLTLDRPAGAGGSSERVEVNSPIEVHGETESDRADPSQR